MANFGQTASRNPLFKKPAIAAVAAAGLVLVASLAGIWGESRLGHAGIWPANAILLGIFALHPKANNPLTWVLSALAYVAASVLAGGSLVPALLLGGVNVATVATGVILIKRFADQLSPITSPTGLVTLFAIMTAMAFAAGILGGLIASSDIAANWLGRFFLRASTEFVNLAVFLPLAVAGRMILGPPPQRLSFDRDRLLRHGIAIGSLLLSCVLMAAVGGPGALAFYLPALIWCSTRVRARVAFGLSSAAALWTLITVPTGLVLLGPEHNHIATAWEMASFRLGVGSIAIATVAVVAINAFWRRTHYEQTQRANYDSLTGLLTRTQFYESAGFTLGRLPDGDTSIALAIDIDRFNTITETHGDPAGDQVIQTVAELLTANIRKGDILGRLGGEEFAILLPGAGLEEGNRVAERMRESIAAEPFQHGTANFTTSVSIGLVEFRLPADFSRMLSLADEALYEAKNSGRNRVVALQTGVEGATAA